MRGRLIFPFLADLVRLDRTASAADPDFREPAAGRTELPPIAVPCQVEPQVLDELRMYGSGDSPRSALQLVFHFRDLERLGLVDPATGTASIQAGDRLAAIRTVSGEVMFTPRTPPGLFVTEARPMGFGLNRACPTRNLLFVTFHERPTAGERLA